MKRLFVFLIGIFLLLPTLPARAAEDGGRRPGCIVEVFNEENGLLSGEANAVLQTRNGYLWIGSYSGLIRYDGSVMQDFSDRLDNSAIRALFEGSDGTLYIGTNGAGAYMLRGGDWTRILSGDGSSFLSIRGFAEGPDGTVYAASTSGMAKLADAELIPCACPEPENARFTGAAADGRGNIWAVSDSGGLFVFSDGGFIAGYSSGELFGSGGVSAVCSDGSENIYVGFTDERIVKLTYAPDTVPEDPGSFARTEYALPGAGAVNEIRPAADGSILVSSLTGFGVLEEESGYRRVNCGLENNISANSAILDGEGSYWVASSNYGVVRFSSGCFDSCNYNSDLGSRTVNAVAKQDGVFYLGTDEGLLLYDENWSPVEADIVEALRGIRIRCITADALGRVWMATYSPHGALCYDPATRESFDFGPAEGLSSEKVRVVYALSDGRMLVGHQGGACIVENGAIVESFGAEDGLETTSVLCAMELDGSIYVGTDGSGIYRLTENGPENLGFDRGLSEGVILRMQPDSDADGNFFVCAADKLFYYEDGSFRRLAGVKPGSGSIFGLYDVGGRLWLLQNGGVFSADKAGVLAGEEVYTAQYGVKCGLTGTLNANTWSWLDEDGTLYIPTRRGVSAFFFRGTNAAMPPVVLNSVEVDDVLYEHPTTLRISKNAKRVTVDISELLFSDTAEFILGYRLDGFDTEMIYTHEKHIAVSYTNLAGGSYTLTVQVTDPITGEYSAEDCLYIVKEKRLSEQTWFYIVCAVLLAAVIALSVRVFIRRKTRLLLKRQEEQQRYIDDITKVFSECVDMRDHYTNGHSSRVAKYTAMLAEKMGKSREEVNHMYHIALLHDVGKIAVPDAVLNKPGRLDDEEYALMKGHSQKGFDVLKEIDIAPDIALGAGCHHERYDGKGYPRGLKGDEIPEVAQIIAVADTFDAMFSTRPYRRKMELGSVVEEIKRCSGTQLSPRVVEAFLELVKDGAFGERPD